VLHLMAHGSYQGMAAEDPKLRAMFTRESTLQSDWYRERLLAKQARDIDLWTRHVHALSAPALDGTVNHDIDIAQRLAHARQQLDRVSGPAYLRELLGTIGADVELGEPSNRAHRESTADGYLVGARSGT